MLPREVDLVSESSGAAGGGGVSIKRSEERTSTLFNTYTVLDVKL